MPQEKTIVENCNENSIEKIVEILRGDIIFFPKSILKIDSVYEESKMLFSIIFTECLSEYAENLENFKVITKAMRERIGEMTNEEIRFNCFCAKSKVRVIRAEVQTLINHTNISKCLKERAVS